MLMNRIQQIAGRSGPFGDETAPFARAGVDRYIRRWRRKRRKGDNFAFAKCAVPFLCADVEAAWFEWAIYNAPFPRCSFARAARFVLVGNELPARLACFIR